LESERVCDEAKVLAPATDTREAIVKDIVKRVVGQAFKRAVDKYVPVRVMSTE
jgi:hypothetical protein